MWTGLSKAAVSERVRTLTQLGLLEEAGELSSRGGRRATNVRLRDRAGFVVGVEIAMTHVTVTATDLGGDVLENASTDISMRQGPDAVLAKVDELASSVIASAASALGSNLIGIGVGVAGPVEFSTGRTIHPPVHPDWHDLPIRDRLSMRFGVPVWVDNEVNLMALAELERGAGQGERDLLVFKLGSWVGAGLVSNGQLHRGAKGSAGSLVTSAGGDAIAQQAELLALSGQSSALAEASHAGRPITAYLVAELAQLGDQACQDLLDAAADDIGRVIAVMTDFFNPALIIVSGGMSAGGDTFLARIRQVVYGHALALATQDLRIVRSELGADAVVVGAALMAINGLLREENLAATLSTVQRAQRIESK